MVSREDLINKITTYQSSFVEERNFCTRFIELLNHPAAFKRDHLPGHLTGSAWIVDETHSYVLLTHHAKLNRWLQPGGHADGDENILRVALREANEETGLRNLTTVSHSIFDIDIHTIPARHEFPEHEHYDVRILLQASRNEPFRLTDESHELAWIPIDEVDAISRNNPSMIRMVAKTKLLRGD